MIGGAGNDTYFVDNTADAVVESANAGADIVYSIIRYTLTTRWKPWSCKAAPTSRERQRAQQRDLRQYRKQRAGRRRGRRQMTGARQRPYFVDNPGDLVTEQPSEGTDTVYASAHYRLGANVEYLVLQGTADLQGYGNDQSNAISGNSGSNVINGGGGPDMLTGGTGNDAFIFEKGQAQGDFVMDFSSGDLSVFVGGDLVAVFHQLDNIRWEVLYDGGASHEVINFMNSPNYSPGRFLLHLKQTRTCTRQSGTAALHAAPRAALSSPTGAFKTVRTSRRCGAQELQGPERPCRAVL